MSDIYYDENKLSSSTVSAKLPLINFAARVATFASLLVSLIILKVGSVTYDNGFVLTYGYFLSYEYMFYISAIGIAYSFFQIPFAFYYLKTRKRLIQSYRFILVEFFSDKVLAFLIGTGVGAAFGATRDLKKSLQGTDSKANQFLDMASVAALFMFLGCLASVVSSILSSFGLARMD